MANQNQWEHLHAEPVGQGSGAGRLKIDEGWIYRTQVTAADGSVAVALCFVATQHYGEPRARNH